MTTPTPRLRRFAGPNGSGKSTINGVISPELLGVYLNPDEMEKAIRRDGFMSVRAYGVASTAEEILGFFRKATLIQHAGLAKEAARLRFRNGKLSFRSVTVNAYFASVAADFLRQRLLAKRASFTLETVMSSPDKVALLEQAQQLGYRTYFYSIATDDPIINVSRVRSRVLRGGHSVPEDKIVSRYARSLSLLMSAIRQTNRAYVFDNSNHERVWLAEITEGKIVELKLKAVPAWFKRAVLDKLDEAKPGR